MELAWLSFRARLRRAWMSSLLIALLIGVIGGFAFAATASARLVDTSYQALLSEIDAPDLLVVPACGSTGSTGIVGCTRPPSAEESEAAREALRDVAAVERVRTVDWVRPYLLAADGTPLLETADNPIGCFDGDRSVGLITLADGGPRDQTLPFRLIGHLPQDDPSGVVLTRATAERVGVGIGDGFTVAGWCTGDGDPIELAEPIDLIVTGLSIGAFDVEPPGSGQTIEPTYVDETVLDALYTADAEPSLDHAVWLRDDSTAEVTRALDGFDVVLDAAEQTATIDEALDADARPLWILALAGALTGLLLLAPIIDRSIRDDTDDVATLVALGSTRTQVGVGAASHIVVVGAGGVLMAIALAPLFAAVLPMGLAGVIVIDRVWFDALVIALGIVLLVSVIAAVVGLSAWRLVAGRRTSRPVTALTTDHAVGRLGLRPPAQTGVLAAVGRPAGRRLLSPWPGLVSLVLACTVCVAGLTYVAGLRHLEDTPDLLGWNWDAAVFVESDADRSRVVAEIGQLDGVQLATTGTEWPPAFLAMPGSDLQVWPWSFATGSGAVTPTMVQGRAPEGPDEVAIDIVFRDLTGLAPGDTVQLERPTLLEQVADELGHEVDPATLGELPEHEPVVATFEVTGVAVLPTDRSQITPQTSFTLDGLAAFAMPSVAEIEATRAWLPDDLPRDVRDEIETRLTDDLDITDRVVFVRTSGDLPGVVARLGELEGIEHVMAPLPIEVVTLLSALNLGGTDNVPLALGILTAIGAFALVTYLLVSTMWARRAELAVLRALGVSSWGVRSSLAVQATSTVVLVLLVAVPVGVAIGQWAWTGYASDLLVVPEPAIPWLGIAALVAGALVVANIVAILVAQVAVKRSAARELRAE